MAKKVKIRSTLPLYAYQDFIKLYKKLLREGNKDKLYFFKGLVYSCFYPSVNGHWRNPKDFIEEICGNPIIFNSYYNAYKVGRYDWFGVDIRESIKRIIL